MPFRRASIGADGKRFVWIVRKLAVSWTQTPAGSWKLLTAGRRLRKDRPAARCGTGFEGQPPFKPFSANNPSLQGSQELLGRSWESRPGQDGISCLLGHECVPGSAKKPRERILNGCPPRSELDADFGGPFCVGVLWTNVRSSLTQRTRRYNNDLRRFSSTIPGFATTRIVAEFC